MIFATVGNATQSFRRLLDAVDALAGKGVFGQDEVVIQSGNTADFLSLYGKQERVLPMEQFSALIAKADLVICHAGAGTLFHVLQARKVPVVMPRRKRYGEHVDDHQMELTRALAAVGRAVPAYEPEDLPAAIAEAQRRSNQPLPPTPSLMLELVGQAIDELMKRGTKND